MKYKIGFIGSGLIARKHLSVIKKLHKEIDIAGCYNPNFKGKNEENLLYLKGVFGRLYLDFEKWLDLENPTMVYICTPPFVRFDYEEKLVKRGIHYFVEKPPLFFNQYDLIRLLKNKEELVIKIGYQWRYLKFNKKLINLIKNDTIGYIYAIRFDELPFQDWKINYNLSAGNTYEKLMHVVDYCEFILGKSLSPVYFVKSESNIGKTIEPDSTLPDTEVLTFKIGDSIGTISSVSYSQSNDIFEMAFVGKRYIYKITTKSNGKIYLEVLKSNKIVNKYSDSTDELYTRETTDFISCIENKDFGSTATYMNSIRSAIKVLSTINYEK